MRFALDELGKRRLIGFAGENYVLYTSAARPPRAEALRRQGLCDALGKLIAKGKESDVYEVLSAKSELYALKLFRLGRTSFRDVTRKRSRRNQESNTWLTSNYNAARHEFAALARLAEVTEERPRRGGHEQAHGAPPGAAGGQALAAGPSSSTPRRSSQTILDTVRDAYTKARDDQRRPQRVQHPDRRGGVWLIDWPQWVDPTHPNAKELMKTRRRTVLAKFFERSYGVSADASDALAAMYDGRADLARIRRV